MSIRRSDDRLHYRSLELPSGTAEVWIEHAGERVTLHTVHPNGGGSSNWLRCAVDTCVGEAVVQNGTYLRHADPQPRAHYLNSLIGSTRALSLNGVSIDQALLEAIRNSSATSGKKMLVPFFLIGANVGCRMDFSGWEFTQACALNAAIFHETADFHGSVFRQSFSASYTDFRGGPGSFSGSTFERGADLSFAHSERQSIGFDSCTFAEGVRAEGVVGSLILQKSSCSRDLTITDSPATVLLDDLSLTGSVDTVGSKFATFYAARLRADAARFLGPMEVKGTCILTDARFAERMRVAVTSERLDMSGVRFERGGRIEVDAQEVLLERLSTGSLLSISGGRKNTPKPVVLSIQNADAGAMSFSTVDMSRCLFYGAHDLDNINGVWGLR